MKVRATPEELKAQIEAAVAEADALQAKANDGSITPEEQAKLDELLASIEALQKELDAANSAQRIQEIKDRSMQPTRSAPRVITESRTSAIAKSSFAEGMFHWLRSGSANAETSTEAYNRCREHGFAFGSNKAVVPCSYQYLNLEKRKERDLQRAYMTTGGVGTGKEWTYKTFSDKVVEYLAADSVLLGLVDTESTKDGNPRDVYSVDATAMKSTFTSASGGSETTPTIPDVTLTSGVTTLNTFTITSGYVKVSLEELQDVHEAIRLEDTIAKGIAASHSRQMTDQIINATGNGTTGIGGLLNVDHSIGSVSAASIDMDDIEELVYSVGDQYAPGCCFLVSRETKRILRQRLKDENGRSLFDTNATQSVKYNTLCDHRIIEDPWMPDDLILFFQPMHYRLRLVENQIFAVLDEKFFPARAVVGVARFGGLYVGPTGANGTIHSLTLTS